MSVALGCLVIYAIAELALGVFIFSLGVRRYVSSRRCDR